MSKLLSRLLRHAAHNSFSLLVIVVFSVGIVQPHKFMVDYNHGTSDYVLAAYEDLVNSTTEKDGSITFESLIVGEDGNTKITYVVTPGDTLSTIAKNFGTTISAITEANNLYNSSIHPGDKLTITYNEGIIYELDHKASLTELAEKYNLNLSDLQTLNYIDNPDAELDIGTQLFVDLNKSEALERGLIQKKEYEMLLVEAPQEEIPEPEVIAAIPAPEEQLQDTRPEILPSEQVVISAEETDQHLKSLGKEEPTPEESSSLCGENKCELNGKCFTKPENAICSTEVQGNAWACKEGFEEKGRSCVAIPQAPVSLCPDNQCELNGKCYNKPDNASCDANSKDNAWVCNEGFEEKGRSCVALPQAAKPVEKAAEPKPAETPKTTEPEEAKIVTLTPKTTSSSNGSKDEEIVSQWYFNPRKAGFGGDGWGGGHCTEYAAYYWWKNYDISLRQYIRGNAGQWYDNAANAGLSVGQTPSVGAIIVMKFGSSGWSSYGHVGIVTEVDLTNRMVRIQDANFMGRYIVTDHWVDMDSEDNPIIGYIYPTI